MDWRLSWPRIFRTIGRLIPFCKAIVANVCRDTCGLTSLVIPTRLATALTMSWARRVLTGNAFCSAKWCSRSARPHSAGHRHHADLGLLTVRAALALEPELALLPEDVLRGEVAKLAAAEPGVEQSPDDEPFGGRLTGIGQTIRLFGGEWFPHVLIRRLSPSKSCVLVVGTRSRCTFRRPGYPHRKGHESGLRPRKPGRSPLRSVAGVGSLSA